MYPAPAEVRSSVAPPVTPPATGFLSAFLVTPCSGLSTMEGPRSQPAASNARSAAPNTFLMIDLREELDPESRDQRARSLERAYAGVRDETHRLDGSKREWTDPWSR